MLFGNEADKTFFLAQGRKSRKMHFIINQPNALNNPHYQAKKGRIWLKATSPATMAKKEGRNFKADVLH